MKIRLGYAAISETLGITYSGTVTYTHYKKLGEKRGNEKIDKVMNANFMNLKEVLTYNIRNDISFFRMSPRMIPLGTHPNVHYEVFHKYQHELKMLGKMILDSHMRVDIHVEEYCVLNSINESVVLSTINILQFYQNMFSTMQLPTYMILHVGSSVGGKKEAMKRFIQNFEMLPDSLKKMILLENDDKVFTARNTLSLCQTLKIPMVFDYHHYLCNHGKEKLDEMIPAILDTWNHLLLAPKMHFSSPKSKKEKRAHHVDIDVDAFIAFIEMLKKYDTDIDIMLEAKGKDEAMFRLIRKLKYKTAYLFEKNTNFHV